MKYLNDTHIKAIQELPEYEKYEERENFDLELLTAMKAEIVEKFDLLHPYRSDLTDWADEAVEAFSKEENDENLIISAVKSSDFKKIAFDLKEIINYSDFDDTKIMSRSCASGFYSQA